LGINEILIILLLFIVAILYSSVGHGGASGYIAILALFNTQTALMKSSSLILNIFVSAIAFFQFYRAGHFKWKMFAFFAITSIPCSYIGSTFPIDDNTYKRILGICIIFPILRLLGIFGSKEPNAITEFGNKEIVISLFIGAGIGFISGMLGIGGGIILSPIILLMGWAGMKQTAAISALFILVNSISGLAGLYKRGIVFEHQSYFWLTSAIAGGIIGSYLGSSYLDNKILKYILSVVLIIASLKLILV
jgi:uncharacterized membrane protein YfcA